MHPSYILHILSLALVASSSPITSENAKRSGVTPVRCTVTLANNWYGFTITAEYDNAKMPWYGEKGETFETALSHCKSTT
jgi:hypothetical protein